jgi:outer membrane protein assembly factor BamB
VANGVVYFGSYDDFFYALDIETGDLLWSFRTESSVSSGPAVVDGMIYMTSWDGSLYAFGPQE